jgi:hypothetical protein
MQHARRGQHSRPLMASVYQNLVYRLAKTGATIPVYVTRLIEE